MGSDPISHTRMGFSGEGLLKGPIRAGVNPMNRRNRLGLRLGTGIGLFREMGVTAGSTIGIGVFLGSAVLRDRVRARMARGFGYTPLGLGLRGKYVKWQVLTPSPIQGWGFLVRDC